MATHSAEHYDGPCKQCGYSLQGVPGNRCPECGFTSINIPEREQVPRGLRRDNRILGFHTAAIALLACVFIPVGHVPVPLIVAAILKLAFLDFENKGISSAEVFFVTSGVLPWVLMIACVFVTRSLPRAMLFLASIVSVCLSAHGAEQLFARSGGTAYFTSIPVLIVSTVAMIVLVCRAFSGSNPPHDKQ